MTGPTGRLRLGEALAALALGTAPVVASSDVDVIFGAGFGSRDRICFGTGSGSFSCDDLEAVVEDSSGVAVGDLNGDSNQDVVVATTSGQNRVCLGDGKGTFDCTGFDEGSDLSWDVALGFIDGDPFLDAFFARGFPIDFDPPRVCLGDGAGGFACRDTGQASAGSFGVALGYVDADPHLDAVLAEGFGTPNRVCLGDGTGEFTCTDLDDSTGADDVALGYVNADPFLDAVFAVPFGPNRVCLGDGTGGFACGDASADANDSTGVALGRIDAGPVLDAVFANGGGADRVCIGNGVGGFTCSDIDAQPTPAEDVAMADVNGDLRLDAVFANDTWPDRVCLGDGAGGFSCSDIDADPRPSTSVAAADVGAPPPCVVELGLDYVGGELVLDFFLRTREPTTWNLWLTLLDTTFPILQAPLPVVEPPLAFSAAIPLPGVGRVGALTTLTNPTRGILCDVRTTAQTRPLEGSGVAPDVAELRRRIATEIRRLADQ